ncbi:MAG: hypothetical protein KDC98_25550 [Planctomycetes bacterium]|nr:hypothetical protein [Planctomycetota bacterium]
MFALIQEATEQAPKGVPLTAGGWIMMILSIGAVTALVVWCYKRILTHPEIDEPDLPGGLGP